MVRTINEIAREVNPMVDSSDGPAADFRHSRSAGNRTIAHCRLLFLPASPKI
jgi:hypothetical protein